MYKKYCLEDKKNFEKIISYLLKKIKYLKKWGNIKKIFKRVSYILSYILRIIILVIIIRFIFNNNLKYFLDNTLKSKLIVDLNIQEILSLNVSILQGLIAIIGIGIALAAYFNFTSLKKMLKKASRQFKEVDARLKKHEGIEDYIGEDKADIEKEK